MADSDNQTSLLDGDKQYSTRPFVGAAGFDKGKAIQKVTFQHEAIIDAILARPRITQIELAKEFGFSAGWMGRMINSDAFRARIAQRKAELTDPAIARRINARLQGVALQAVETISRKLDATDSADFALEALGIAVTAMPKVAK